MQPYALAAAGGQHLAKDAIVVHLGALLSAEDPETCSAAAFLAHKQAASDVN